LKAETLWDWRKELIRSGNEKILPLLANAITALRWAPEWCGVLAWDEFSMRVVALHETPWGGDGAWTDQEDRRTTEWLQRHGILVKLTEAGHAVQTVARDHAFHPVRHYLGGLKWDGISRIDHWLTTYAGAGDSKLTRAVGARWLISGVARAYRPGCKVDCCLILEGLQDIGKSTVFSILGGEWYSDDVAELGTKDAALGTRGKWILEFAELDSIARATPSKIKAFFSRATDHFRLPYDRRAGDFPRECIFSGSVNHPAYLRDETGGRRFWPIGCGRIDLDALRRDRDQLWAEATVRFKQGERWWLDTPELVSAAEVEQSERYDDDPWEGPITTWLEARTDTSISEILSGAIRKNVEHWTQADKTRVARILLRLKWKRYKKRIGDEYQWRYKYVPSSQLCSQSVPSSK
jgi:predicted P-loop ATPase